MKKSKTSIMISILAIVSVASSLYFVIPGSIEAQSEEKTFVTHNVVIVSTTGEVLDPLYTSATMEFDPMEYLREFNYGRVSQLPDGTTLREFTIIAEDDKIMEVSSGVFYNVWTFNGTVPGPTIRATEGDIVRINFINNGSKSHTMHFHGIHPAEMDGVFEPVGPGGGQFTYGFEAGPVGVHPYHCHMMPLEEHIVHGLYGVYIVDPKEGRAPADEMVMVLNGLDTDFDPVNNLHLHGNLYHYYPTGSDTIPSFYTDMITLSQTERGIIEFEYDYPGKYLFHAHKVEFSEKGWIGIFLVKENPKSASIGVEYGS